MHGEHGALLNRRDSIRLQQTEMASRLSALAFDAISLTLFGMPSTHWQSLQEIYVNDAVDSVTWRQFIEKLKREWKLSTIPVSLVSLLWVCIYSLSFKVTVLLGANASFLQIEAVGLGSFASIACFISMAFCIENFILCHILSRLFCDVHCIEMAPIVSMKEELYSCTILILASVGICDSGRDRLAWCSNHSSHLLSPGRLSDVEVWLTVGLPTLREHEILTLGL